MLECSDGRKRTGRKRRTHHRVGIVLALICLVATFAVPSFRPGVIGVAVFLAVMLAWYWLFRRHSVEVL